MSFRLTFRFLLYRRVPTPHREPSGEQRSSIQFGFVEEPELYSYTLICMHSIAAHR